MIGMDYFDIVNIIAREWKKESAIEKIDFGEFISDYVDNMRGEEVLEYCLENPGIRDDFIQLGRQKLFEELLEDVENEVKEIGGKIEKISSHNRINKYGVSEALKRAYRR